MGVRDIPTLPIPPQAGGAIIQSQNGFAPLGSSRRFHFRSTWLRLSWLSRLLRFLNQQPLMAQEPWCLSPLRSCLPSTPLNLELALQSTEGLVPPGHPPAVPQQVPNISEEFFWKPSWICYRLDFWLLPSCTLLARHHPASVLARAGGSRPSGPARPVSDLHGTPSSPKASSGRSSQETPMRAPPPWA